MEGMPDNEADRRDGAADRDLPSEPESATPDGEGDGGGPRSSARRARPSLKDVAQRAGVSVMTASNVVRDAPYVSATTRSRVQRAIEETGYRPNLSARNLRAGRSGVISLAVPSISTPYFAELAQHVMDAAAEHDWNVLIEQTRGRAALEAQAVAGQRPALADGLILFPTALGPAALGRSSGGRPMVLLGDRGHRGPGDVVVVDNRRAAFDATAHLADRGARRIAAIGWERRPSLISRRRMAGYRDALAANGCTEPASAPALVTGYSRAEGARAMADLLDRSDPPDAVFCFNDLLAVGAVRAVLSRGLRVPEDVAVAGFDDTEEAAYGNPPLTTAAPDKRQIADLAVGLLHARMGAGASTPFRLVTVPHHLVVRDSTVADSTERGAVPDG